MKNEQPKPKTARKRRISSRHRYAIEDIAPSKSCQIFGSILVGLMTPDIPATLTKDQTVTDRRFDAPGDPGRSSGNKIEKRVWIKASAEVVYRALTSSKELARWFCDRADCNPYEGGEFIAFWKTGKDGQKGRAIFTRVVPNSLLELIWMEDGRDTEPGSPKHTLCYTIKSKAGMTEVVMVDNDDTVADEETYAFLDQGWNSVLLELKDFCERRERSVKSRSDSKYRAKYSSDQPEGEEIQ